MSSYQLIFEDTLSEYTTIIAEKTLLDLGKSGDITELKNQLTTAILIVYKSLDQDDVSIVINQKDKVEWVIMIYAHRDLPEINDLNILDRNNLFSIIENLNKESEKKRVSKILKEEAKLEKLETLETLDPNPQDNDKLPTEDKSKKTHKQEQLPILDEQNVVNPTLHVKISSISTEKRQVYASVQTLPSERIPYKTLKFIFPDDLIHLALIAKLIDEPCHVSFKFVNSITYKSFISVEAVEFSNNTKFIKELLRQLKTNPDIMSRIKTAIPEFVDFDL